MILVVQPKGASLIRLTDDQKAMILGLVEECREEGVSDDRLPYELQGFIRSMGNQTRSQDLRELATDPKAIAQLIAEIDGKPVDTPAPVNSTPDAGFLTNSKDEDGNYPGGLEEQQLINLRDAIAEVFDKPIDAIHDVSTDDDDALIITFESEGLLYTAEANDDRVSVEQIGSVE